MADSRTGRVLSHLHHWLRCAATPSDDAQLLKRFVRQRDEKAFAELVSRHGTMVLGLCRRLLGNVHDAEDVFQAAFFVLARKAATIRKPGALSSWLHGIAYRLALKARAEIERRRIHERQAAPFSECSEVDYFWREVRGLLDEELQRLPEKQRLPLVLCYLEGLTQDEAAQRLGWPRGTLKRRLEAGRERLRLRLTRRGITLGVGLFAIALTESATKSAVPTGLRAATVRATIQFLSHETSALNVTSAALLARGALQTMLISKLKLGAMLILLLGCAVTAAGLAIPQAPPEKPSENNTQAPAAAPPTELKHVRRDRYGDPLPTGAIARLGTVRLRHPFPTTSAVFTRDGKTAIVGDSSGLIIYWDVATGKEVRRLQPGGAVYALAITADGKTLASASGDQLFFWAVASGKLLSHARLDKEAIIQVLFTPDGKTLALRGQGNTLYLWDTVGNKKLHDLTGHKGNVSCMALSPDGKTLASGSWQDSNIRLWDVASGKEKRQIATGGGEVLSLAFSPDGKTLAAISNRAGFAFFDPNTGKQLRKVRDYYGGLSTITYATDGKSLIGIDSRTVHILDAASGKLLRKFDAPPRVMAGLAISPDGRTLATVWGGPATFDLWDTASGKLLHSFAGHRSAVTGLAFAADGATLFSSAMFNDYGLYLWDATTGELCSQIDDIPLIGLHGLALSSDGKLLAAGGSGSLRLLDPATRKVVRSCIGCKEHENIASVAWSADGKTLLSSHPNEKTIHVWNPATGKQRRVIDTKQSVVGQIALSPDGAMAAASGNRDGTVRLWAIATGKELRQLTTGSEGTMSPVAFSPSGTILACGGSRISLWEPATGRLLRRWNAQADQLIFSRDGRTLVSANFRDATVRLWETATGEDRASFAGRQGGIETLAISRDSRRIASGSEDTTILVWDATGGALPTAALSAEQMQRLWRDLRDADAGCAYRGMWQLTLSPKQALPFLAARLFPVGPLDASRQKTVDRLLVNLDSDQFAVRQSAEAELEKMGLMIEPALRKALETKLSLEVRRRIETVLASLEELADERLRLTRALEAIGHMNTPDALRLLETLASGEPFAWLTQEANAIRKRFVDESITPPER